ncbi:formate dehydrogenase accessory protein, partial [Paramagnetospirillum caucaseum]
MSALPVSAATTRRPAVETVTVERWRDGAIETADDVAAAEVPVCLEYNGISHAVMLASPADLEDFALGFSLTEGIVDHPRDILDLETEERCEGIAVRLTVTAQRFHRLKERRRSLAGRTGCGLCGTESLSQVFRDIPRLPTTSAMAAPALQEAFQSLASN